MRGIAAISLAVIAGTAVAKDCGGRGGAADACWSYSAQVENDAFFNGGDRNYSHGVRLSAVAPEGSGRDALPDGFVLGRSARFFGSLAHEIYTPANIKEPRFIPGDRPYAAWLNGGIGAVAYPSAQAPGDWGLIDSVEVSFGLVGSGAMGKAIQSKIHDWVDSPQPRGWTNELHNEPTVQFYGERQFRSPSLIDDGQGGRIADATPYVGAAFGNVFAYGAVGMTLRLGADLPNDTGPSGIKPGLPGTPFVIPAQDFSAYFFVGGQGRAVGHNIFLDGNTFQESASVNRRIWVGDLYAGFEVVTESLRFAFTQVWRSQEFDTQTKRHQFSAFTLGVRF